MPGTLFETYEIAKQLVPADIGLVMNQYSSWDHVIDRGECDFVSDVAGKLPTAAICDLMGIGREHWDQMFAITNETVGRHDQEFARGRSGRETVMEAHPRAARFFVELAAERRRQPGDDLVSALVSGAMAGEPLTEAEIIANC